MLYYYLALLLPPELNQQIRSFAHFLEFGQKPKSLAHVTIIPPFGIAPGQEQELLPLLIKIAEETVFPVAPFLVCFDELAVWEDSSSRSHRFFLVAKRSSAQVWQKLDQVRLYYLEKYLDVCLKTSCSTPFPHFTPHITLLKELTSEEAAQAKEIFCPLLPLTWMVDKVVLLPRSGTPALNLVAASITKPG